MVELTRRTSFRKSKSSFKEIVEGREYFFTATKKDKNVLSIYDTLTGILVAVCVKEIEYTKQWISRNKAEIDKRLKQYEPETEPSLFG